MNSLDIFQKLPGGTRVWICGAQSVQEAKTRLVELQQAEPAEYYACDLAERVVVVASTLDRPELHTVADDSEFFGTRHRETAWRRSPGFQRSKAENRHFGLAAR